MAEDRASQRKESKIEISAGGIVYKKDVGQIFVLLIMPARRNDLKTSDFVPMWTFPKGWVGDHGDEQLEQTAVREVREEGGINARVVSKIGEANYSFTWKEQLISKTVHWFLMEYVDGDPVDHDHEVENAEWVPSDEAQNRLTYPTDKEIFAKAKELLNDR